MTKENSTQKIEGIVSGIPSSSEDDFVSTWAGMAPPDEDINLTQISGLNTIVPQLVDIPGYKVGWIPVSTQIAPDNVSRTRASAMQGWRPITFEEYRQYDPITAASLRMRHGNVDLIQIRDLVAAKVPVKIWRQIQEAQAKMINQNNKSNLESNKGRFRTGSETEYRSGMVRGDNVFDKI